MSSHNIPLQNPSSQNISASSENPPPPKKFKEDVPGYVNNWTDIVYSHGGDTTGSVWGNFYKKWWGPTSEGKAFFERVEQRAIEVGDRAVWDCFELPDESTNWMFVRDEYAQIYDRLCRLSRKGGFGGVALTGSPGIGKSYFAIYALLRRLTEGKTTLFSTTAGTSYLFHRTGVRWKAKEQVRPLGLPLGESDPAARVWSLIDTPENEKSSLSRGNLFVLITCSPDERRYKHWRKEKHGLTWVMNPWSEEELHVFLSNSKLTMLSEAQRNSHSSLKSIQKLRYRVGPCLRDILYSITSPNEQERDLQTALHGLDLGKLIELFKSSVEHPNWISHKVIVLRRVGDLEPLDGDTFEVDFKSQVIRRRVMETLKDLSVEEVRRQFTLTRRFTAGSQLARWLLEALVNYYIRGEKQLNLAFPLFASMSMNPTSKWPCRVEHYIDDAPISYVLEIDDSTNFHLSGTLKQYTPPSSQSVPPPSLPIRLRTAFPYDDVEDLELTTEKWYCPMKTNNPLFDSFFFDVYDERIVLWVFQMTIAKTHSGARRGFKILGEVKKKIKSAFGKNVVVNLVLVTPRIHQQLVLWNLPKDWEDLKKPDGGDVYIQYVDLGLDPSDYDPLFVRNIAQD